MATRTLTFDPKLYKLVPVEPDDFMSAEGLNQVYEPTNANDVDRAWSSMLAAVPDTLPGVIEHSGKPSGLLVETEQGPMYWPPSESDDASAYCEDDAEPAKLFTHPAPAQPVERQELSDAAPTHPPCPITGRKWWGDIDHPEMGLVPTYGGPFDTYTAPYADEDGELRCERFDQDAGHWIEGGEPLGVYLTTEQPNDEDLPSFINKDRGQA